MKIESHCNSLAYCIPQGDAKKVVLLEAVHKVLTYYLSCWPIELPGLLDYGRRFARITDCPASVCKHATSSVNRRPVYTPIAPERKESSPFPSFAASKFQSSRGDAAIIRSARSYLQRCSPQLWVIEIRSAERYLAPCSLSGKDGQLNARVRVRNEIHRRRVQPLANRCVRRQIPTTRQNTFAPRIAFFDLQRKFNTSIINACRH